jgi:hypothetical protein
VPEVPFRDRELPDRPAGAVILGIVALLAWWFLYRPLVALQEHNPNVTYSFTFIALQPLLLGWGLAHLAFGADSRKYFGRLNNPTIAGWIVWGFLFLCGIALAIYVKELLKSAGYIP